MNTIETKQWTNAEINRKQWGSGPWDGEPDKKQWQDAATGMACLAVRHSSSGHWCGYVGVPKQHPLHGKDYDSVDARVHGGLTFAAKCSPEGDPSKGVCHVADEEVWWFGFDCAHYLDLTPGHRMMRDEGDKYRSLAYVESECAQLAQQLADLR